MSSGGSTSGGRKENGRKSVKLGEFFIEERLLIDPKALSCGRKIGRGAHGQVYEGRYEDDMVAIKVIECEKTSNVDKAVFESRFAREVVMMSKVTHDNIVKFIGACKYPYMIVTELLPGMSLEKHLESIRPERLNIHVALKYALDISLALEFLHGVNIIHRDVKPDNILLTEDYMSVKLADFGLAREEAGMMTAETGTYRWMAPELCDIKKLGKGQKKQYSKKVDVFSFGMVFWELLLNRIPFEEWTPLRAAIAIAYNNKRPKIPRDIPVDLASIIKSCWHKNPEKRPSFTEIIQMLNQYLSKIGSSEPKVGFPFLGRCCGRD